MAAAIDFWLSLGSPAAYLASLRVDEIGARHGREVRWRPFDIRKALTEEGVKPNVAYPRKGAYARRDWARTARLHGHPFRMPDPFGRSSVAGSVIAYWAEAEHGHAALKAFCRAYYAAYFVQNRAVDTPEVLGDLAAEAGLDPDAALRATEDTRAQARLETATTAALEAGVWGAPVVSADGEPFWGEDRLDQVDLWLERGGW